MPLVAAAAAAFVVLWVLVWLARAVRQEYGPHRVPCLLYHQLQARGGAHPLEVDPVYVCYADSFSEQMDYLKEAGYTTLTLGQFLDARRNPAKLPVKPVLVTLDDGFASNYTIAYPVLKKHGQTATIFVTPDRTSHNFKTFAHLDQPLTDEQIRELARGGIDIQSHGLTHRFLTDLDDSDLRRELEESRAILERITGRPVRFLAIPGGAYDRRVRRMALDVGYEAVFCMRKGSAGISQDPYLLPRMVISRDMTLEEFRRLLSPAGWLRGRLASVAQETISRCLGMPLTDALRDRLYASPLARMLRPGTLPWVVLAFLAAGLVALGAVVVWGLR